MKWDQIGERLYETGTKKVSAISRSLMDHTQRVKHGMALPVLQKVHQELKLLHYMQMMLSM